MTDPTPPAEGNQDHYVAYLRFLAGVSAEDAELLAAIISMCPVPPGGDPREKQGRMTMATCGDVHGEEGDFHAVEIDRKTGTVIGGHAGQRPVELRLSGEETLDKEELLSEEHRREFGKIPAQFLAKKQTDAILRGDAQWFNRMADLVRKARELKPMSERALLRWLASYYRENKLGPLDSGALSKWLHDQTKSERYDPLTEMNEKIEIERFEQKLYTLLEEPEFADFKRRKGGRPRKE